MSGSASFFPPVVISNRGVSHPYSCRREEYISLFKFRHGTCMYEKLQHGKPLSVTDIFQQQSKIIQINLSFRQSYQHVLSTVISTCFFDSQINMSFRQSYRGSPTRMRYLDYILLYRYTILVGNPQYQRVFSTVV